MKILVFLIFLMVSINGQAQETTQNNDATAQASTNESSKIKNTSTLVSLFSIQSQNESILRLGYVIDSETNTKYKFAGSSVQANKTKDSALGMAYTHGVDNQLTVGVSIDYAIESKTDTSYGPASSKNGQIESTKGGGISEPTFGAIYRLLDQGGLQYPWILDITGSYSPKTGNRNSGSTTESGNNLRGGDLIKIQLETGKEFQNGSAFNLGISYSYYGKRSSVDSDATGGNTTRLSASGQLAINKNSFFNGIFSTASTSNQSISSGSSNATLTAFSYTSIAIGGKYLFTESLMASLIYGISNDASFDYKAGLTTLNCSTDVKKLSALVSFAF